MQNVRNGIRETRDMVTNSKRNNFHVSKPMAQIAAEAKHTDRDPFKTPDPMLVAQEEVAERQERLEA